jgi:hypothetical protein
MTGHRQTIYSVAGIIGKSFSKAFTKHNTEKGFNVTEMYPPKCKWFMKANSCPPGSLTYLTVIGKIHPMHLLVPITTQLSANKK